MNWSLIFAHVLLNLKNWERPGYAASEGSGRGAALGHRLSPARRHEAREEGQLRRGGGEGGAQEEIGEVVS